MQEPDMSNSVRDSIEAVKLMEMPPKLQIIVQVDWYPLYLIKVTTNELECILIRMYAKG